MKGKTSPIPVKKYACALEEDSMTSLIFGSKTSWILSEDRSALSRLSLPPPYFFKLHPIVFL
ncbi:MAG: hypothetical protein OXC03_08940 [Flavobacteriaceae bacterium]|nr:hypothetical protein [Flavobacteriaceae bacterium]